ncbi:hypothetical protein Cgig2_012701 [Carnegiea gigantea]|uniref:Uncharacterized protein n=1 Tax=Carnegiea gigantea TaxID=171969 RepID=A0A9Q1JX23_9CARY|nr:hypothetical protein Cgig2_012701 [Carnegiea gigantea]
MKNNNEIKGKEKLKRNDKDKGYMPIEDCKDDEFVDLYEEADQGCDSVQSKSKNVSTKNNETKIMKQSTPTVQSIQQHLPLCPVMPKILKLLHGNGSKKLKRITVLNYWSKKWFTRLTSASPRVRKGAYEPSPPKGHKTLSFSFGELGSKGFIKRA